MLCFGTQPESYKSYKNRTFKKHTDKMTNQLNQINQCSLRESDKKDLMKKLLEIISEQNPQKK